MIFIILIVPAIVGLVEMLKKSGLPTRWAGPVAILIGIVIMIAYSVWGDLPIFFNVLLGLLAALGATGFYDLTKLHGGGNRSAVTVNTAGSPTVELDTAYVALSPSSAEDGDVDPHRLM